MLHYAVSAVVWTATAQVALVDGIAGRETNLTSDSVGKLATCLLGTAVLNLRATPLASDVAGTATEPGGHVGVLWVRHTLGVDVARDVLEGPGDGSFIDSVFNEDEGLSRAALFVQ